MTTLLKKDYQYSSVLWEEVMQRVQEIIRDEYNISPYVSPTLNPKTPSPFRIWSSAQGTDALYVGAWHKEYTISVNHYLKTEDSERFYRKVYEESERLYQLFFNNQGTQSTQTLGFFGGRPEGIQISQEGDYFRIEVLFTCEVLRADDVVYVQTLPSEIRATKRALELPFNFWSLDFDGTDDYIDAGSGTSLDDIWSGGGTLSAWVNCDSPSSNRAIASQAGNGNQGWFLTLENYSTGVGKHPIIFNVKWDNQDLIYTTGTYNGDGTVNRNYVVPINTWSHIVVTYNSDSYENKPKIYLNGQIITEIHQIQPTVGNSYKSAAAYSFEIGRKNTSGHHDFNGAMSEVAIFNSVLSSSEISTIYNDGQPILLTENQGGYKSSSNLVSYYRMGSGSGDIREKDSAIFDQVNSGIGSELIDDTTFANADNTSDSTWGKWRSTGSFNALEDTIATFANNTMTIHDDGSETPMSDIGEKDYFNPSGGIYLLTCDITRTAGRLHFKIGNASSGTNHGTAEYDGTWAKGSGTIIFYIQVGTNTDPPMLRTHGSEGFIGTVKNFSIKKLNGNPGKMKNFDSLDFRTNVPLLYDKALFSNSLLFDGTDDEINTGLEGLSAGSSFTFSAWINGNTFASTDKTIISNGLETNHRLFSIENGKLFLRIYEGGYSGDDLIRAMASATFSTGVWYNAVATYDGTNIKLYINGIEETTTEDGAGSTGNVSNTTTIGYLLRSTKESFFSGNIADVAVYNTVLNQSNVTAIYNSGKPIDLTCDAGNYNNANNLVGYWKMGDGYLDELPSATHGGAIYDQVTPVEGSDISVYDGEDVNVSAYANIEADTLTSVQSGCVYKFNYTITNYVSGSFRIRQSSGASSLNVPGGTGNGNGNYEFYLLTTNTNNFVIDAYNFGFVGTISNYEVRKVEGNVGLAQNMNASAQSISVPK